MGLVLCLLVVASAIKLVGVQVGDGSELAERGEDQRIRSVDLEAQRGSVLDRNGVELAISVPTRRVVTDMAALREQGVEDRSDIEQLAQRLAPVLEVDAGALAEALLSAGRTIHGSVSPSRSTPTRPTQRSSSSRRTGWSGS